ncbi:MAG: DUF664 domain-containing protein [Streptosporangiales bacterium]|nr:DUF664 domain-containing protein [Streptosporangiales bacterium]
MTDVDEYGRPEPPQAGDEIATLLGFLDFQRATLAWKCRGLDAAGLAVMVGVSEVTLGGLLMHLARVEEIWFSVRLHGRDHTPPWDKAEWAWEWGAAAAEPPERLWAIWEEAVDRSRACVAEALGEGGGMDRLAARPWPNGVAPSLRWIVTHMIEEYARHNGHADLIREAVDGSTGE